MVFKSQNSAILDQNVKIGKRIKTPFSKYLKSVDTKSRSTVKIWEQRVKDRGYTNSIFLPLPFILPNTLYKLFSKFFFSIFNEHTI